MNVDVPTGVVALPLNTQLRVPILTLFGFSKTKQKFELAA